MIKHESIPFAVDLDGTLILKDLTFEGIKSFLRIYPFQAYKLLWWFLKGRAHLKRKIVESVPFPSHAVILNQKFLRFLRPYMTHKYKLVLATGTDIHWAQQVADQLQIFHDVLGSDGGINLTSHHKAQALNRMFGKNQYVYAGNSSSDLAVWKFAHEIVVVNASARVLKKAVALKKTANSYIVRVTGGSKNETYCTKPGLADM